MATAIRAIPTLYGETAQHFERRGEMWRICAPMHPTSTAYKHFKSIYFYNSKI